MDLEKLAGFFVSYPLWAQVLSVGGVVVTGATLIFAPRRESGEEAKAPDAKAEGQPGVVYLTILGVRMYKDASAPIKISGTINGQSFHYPGTGAAKFMKAGPAMSLKHVEVPAAQKYEVEFALVKMEDAGWVAGRPVDADSQQVGHIWPKQIPYRGTYRLYEVRHGVRSAEVLAELQYELTTELR